MISRKIPQILEINQTNPKENTRKFRTYFELNEMKTQHTKICKMLTEETIALNVYIRKEGSIVPMTDFYLKKL